MSEKQGTSQIARYLPHVMAATLLVLALPSACVYFLEAVGLLDSYIGSFVVAVVISVGLAQLMQANRRRDIRQIVLKSRRQDLVIP